MQLLYELLNALILNKITAYEPTAGEEQVTTATTHQYRKHTAPQARPVTCDQTPAQFLQHMDKNVQRCSIYLQQADKPPAGWRGCCSRRSPGQRSVPNSSSTPRYTFSLQSSVATTRLASPLPSKSTKRRHLRTAKRTGKTSNR